MAERLRLIGFIAIAGLVVGIAAWALSSCGSTARAPTHEAATEEPAFRRFAEAVNDAVRRQDIDFFSTRADTTHVVCKPEVLGLGGPACDYVGQEFEGLPLARWGSEGSIVSLEAAMRLVSRLWTEGVASASDAYGKGEARVYAIGSNRLFADNLQATVLTALIERPADFAGSGPLRISLVLDWRQAGDSWRLVGMLSAFVTGDQFLRPSDEVRRLIDWEKY